MLSASKREVECVREREMIGQKWREMMTVTLSKLRGGGGGDWSNEIREKKKG